MIAEHLTQTNEQLQEEKIAVMEERIANQPFCPTPSQKSRKKKSKKKSQRKSADALTMNDSANESERTKKKKKKHKDNSKGKKMSEGSSSSLAFDDSAGSLDASLSSFGSPRTSAIATIHSPKAAPALNPIHESRHDENVGDDDESYANDGRSQITLQRSERSLLNNFSSAVASAWGGRSQGAVESLSTSSSYNKDILDEIASFAEASLGTTADDASALLSAPGGIENSMDGGAGLTHELLVTYMISVGATRENAERLAFSFMSQQSGGSRNQRRASSRQSPSRDVVATISRSRSNRAGLDGTRSMRIQRSNKISFISKSSSASSLRSEISDFRQCRRQSAGPLGYLRADEPGAVEMEGRAFGAPRRIETTQREEFEEEQERRSVDLVVKAEPVEEAGFPIIYADSSPLSIKYAFQSGPIRKFIFAGIILLIISISVICYFVVSNRSAGTGTSLSGTGNISVPSTAPTVLFSTAPTLVLDEVLNVARQISGTSLLDEQNSPQFRAVGWLSSVDQVDPEGYGSSFVQRYVMVAFFFSAYGEQWLEKEEWLSPTLHECDWSNGIQCETDVAGRSNVVGIDLTRNRLQGTIPKELKQLSSLQSLNLEKNSIEGSLPSDIFELTRLSLLKIPFNKITGQLPINMGNATEMTDLSLSDNAFTGHLPDSLWDLSLLRELDLSRNKFNGTITDNVNLLQRLVTLDLRRNLFSGIFPRAVDKMEKLDYLLLDYNKFTGSLPPLDAGFIALQEISFSNNLLTGSLPDINPANVFNQLASVRVSKIDISHNLLTGNLNPAISFLPTLRYVDVSGNLFENGFPASIGWGTIEYLAAADNFFNGTIGTNWQDKLQLLDFSGNEMTGSLPTGLCQFPNIEFLLFSDNSLEGSLPSCYTSFKKLRALELSNTGMSGSLPSSMDELLMLNVLNLSNNTFTGTLPTTMDNLLLLNQLLLGKNLFSGEIPTEFGKLVFLQNLGLSDNSLVGTIPTELSKLTNLESLSLGGNQLTGLVPEEMCELPAIELTTSNFGNDVSCSCCIDELGWKR